MKLFFIFALMLSSGVAQSQQALKVGGMYVVKNINQVAEKYFVIEFESQEKSGRFDILKLESDHVHFSVREGQSLRLSAEVLTEKGNIAEVSQVLLFLPHIQGFTPIWMLSRKADGGDLRGSKYIEMHSPQSDYVVF